MQVLYPKYSLLFLFDNTTSYFVYFKDVFQVKNINKGLKKNRFYEMIGLIVKIFALFNQCIW